MNIELLKFTKTVYKFSVFNGFVANKLKIQKAYQSHPMQNSLRCVSDVLDQICIPHEVYSLANCNSINLKGSMLYIPSEATPLHYVTAHLNDYLTLENGEKVMNLTIQEIKSNHNAYAIVPVPNIKNKISHNDFVLYLSNFLWNLGDNGILSFIFILLFVLIFLNLKSTPVFLLRFFLFCGLLISSIILKKELSDNNSSKGICEILHSVNCLHLINNKGMRILGILSPGDLSIIYFLVELILSLTFPDTSLFSTFLFLSYFTLPVVAFSIIWQVKNNSFCVYCLSIDMILVSELILLLIANNINTKINISYIIYFLLGYCTLLLFMYLIRSNLLSRSAFVRLKNKEEMILSNQNLFPILLQFEKRLVFPDELTFQTINNQLCEFSHWLLIFMNPFCSHCQETVKELKNLEDIRIDIIFAVYDDEGLEAASWILENFDNHTEDFKMQNILNQWYSSTKLQKRLKSSSPIYTQIAMQHSHFARIKKIYKTPIIYVDGKILPKIYDISELKFIL